MCTVVEMNVPFPFTDQPFPLPLDPLPFMQSIYGLGIVNGVPATAEVGRKRRLAPPNYTIFYQEPHALLPITPYSPLTPCTIITLGNGEVTGKDLIYPTYTLW